MNPEFERKVIEDLEKSGFSSELYSIRTFISNKWNCSGFANFFDLDLDLITGVDLRAWKLREVRINEFINYGVHFYIEAEVKKSEKPWVLFKEFRQIVVDDYSNNLIHISGITPYRLKKALSQNSVYSQSQWRAYGLHESFKKPDAPSRSYSAFIKVCKSAESMLESASGYFKEMELDYQKNPDNEYKEPVLIFVKPIVILDGKLLAANLSEKGEISIEEIKFASIEFYYRSKHCRKGVYLIDIVTLESLQEYIELSEVRQITIFDEIKNLIEKSQIK